VNSERKGWEISWFVCVCSGDVAKSYDRLGFLYLIMEILI